MVKKEPGRSRVLEACSRQSVLFARIIKVHEFDHIGGVDAPERSVAVARSNDLIVSADDKFRRLDDLPAFFPKRSQLISDVARNTVTDRERDFVGYFLRLVERIDTRRNHFHVERFKLVLNSFESRQLTATVGSPVTPVKQDNPVLGVQAIRQVERSAADEINRQIGKRIAYPKLVRHCCPSMLKQWCGESAAPWRHIAMKPGAGATLGRQLRS